jgi:hypothetical protein
MVERRWGVSMEAVRLIQRVGLGGRKTWLLGKGRGDWLDGRPERGRASNFVIYIVSFNFEQLHSKTLVS